MLGRRIEFSQKGMLVGESAERKREGERGREKGREGYSCPSFLCVAAECIQKTPCT